MANIKISQLSELNKDQLTSDDQFIVNDSNSVTTRVGYGTIVEAITGSELNFSGNVEFSGQVRVTGDLANNDVYTKQGTLDEIDKKVDPVKLDVAANATDVENLRQLAGIDRTVGAIPSFYIGGTFTSTVIPEFAAGPLNIVGAVNAIGKHLEFTVTPKLASLAADVSANTVSIQTNLDKNIAQDLRLDDLEAAVGTPSNITNNSNNITGNTDNIAKLAGVVGVGVGDQTMGSMNGTYLVDNSNVKANLQSLNSQAVTETARVTSVIGDLTNTDTAVAANTGYIQKLTNIIDTAAQGVQAGDTVQDFAAALATAIAAALTANPKQLP